VISYFTVPRTEAELGKTIWHASMLKLPEEETAGGYPWWKRIEFWFGLLTLCFVVIYAVFW
jgi:hypothetical protein